MPLFDYQCLNGHTFEALGQWTPTVSDPRPCRICHEPCRRLLSAGSSLIGSASIPPSARSAPTSWNGTHQANRDVVTGWRRNLDARARLESKYPEIADEKSPVLAHEGAFEATPLTWDNANTRLGTASESARECTNSDTGGSSCPTEIHHDPASCTVGGAPIASREADGPLSH